MLVLTDDDVRLLLTLEDTIRIVDRAFAADAEGKADIFQAIVSDIDRANANFGLKSSYLASSRMNDKDLLGLKAGGYWRDNQQKYGIPNHRATILMLNIDTGEASSVMAANAITRMRTAAAGAVAAMHLSRHDAQTVAVLGAGEQAHAQLEALMLVRGITRVRVWARRTEAAKAAAATFQASGLDARSCESIEEAVRDADIIITTTPATTPLLQASWVSSGTHINAIGSDSDGKRELPYDLIKGSKFVADKFKQSVTLGELQHIAQDDIGARKHLYAELGEICSGLREGRANPEEITVFDSSGISIQDVAVAGHLEELARQRQIGTIIAL